MKIMKNSLAFLLALMMILTLAAPALAAGGQITITNAAAGHTYSIYKLLDATYMPGSADANGDPYTAYSISTSDQFYEAIRGEGSPFKLGGTASDAVRSVTIADGKTEADVLTWLTQKETVEVEGKTVEVIKLVNGKTPAATPVTQPTGGNTVTFSDLAYGYYLITTSQGAVVTIDNANPSASVIDKYPTQPGPAEDLDGDAVADEYKYIVNQVEQDGSTVTVYSDEDSASVGDNVSFKIAFKATNYETTGSGKATVTKHIIDYTITDVPDGLKVDTDSFAVKVDGTSLASTAYSITKTTDTNEYPVIELPWATKAGDTYTSIYKSPVTVEIDFTAEVLRAGTSYNDVTIGYTAVMGGTENTENVVVADSNHETTISNYGFSIIKQDGQANNGVHERLVGAEFKLYATSDGATEISLVKVSKGVYRPKHSNDEAASVASVIECIDTDDASTTDINEKGTARILGLEAGVTYYIEETKAPDGYNKLDGRTAVTINSNGNATVTVNNTRGIELPSTGGVGTTVFYIAGGVLVLLAIVLLAGKKRGESKKR